MSGPLFVKLEVTWADHPKIIAAGLAGRGLHATAMCIAKRLETDGWIDRALLYREGADDALIDRLVELGLFDTDGSAVRPHNWHDRNPSQDAIDATRNAKAEAARRGNHRRWKHPGDVADCPICAPDVQVDRISDRSGSHPVAEPSPDTETDTDTTTPPPSLRTTPVDEQQIRATAVAVGRVLAADAADPAAYAASITRRILTGDDPTDRERIVSALSVGESVETIAAGWETLRPDWLTYGGSTQQGQADGPDTAAFYAGREAKRREQMQDQAPADPEVARSGAQAAREALRAPVAAS